VFVDDVAQLQPPAISCLVELPADASSYDSPALNRVSSTGPGVAHVVEQSNEALYR
jgi:hypothetical protein